ncbi:hypothetical protein C8Q77DRAFT_849812 [Trametes polyzona]|nr:hypothetical protein C8Q77DRAFT_849812 [Trametes polyzona]
MAASSSKASAYAKRNSSAHTVPLEEDSDSDFNPGAYIPETKKRGRKSKDTRKPDGSSDASPPSKRRRRDTLAKIGGKSYTRDGEPQKTAVPLRPNLLLQYFGDIGIKLVPDSEEEKEDDADAEDDDDEEHEDEDEDEDKDEEGNGVPPPLPRTLAVLLEKKQREKEAQADDDSVTEFDSDSDDGAPPSRPSPPKRAATGVPMGAGAPPAKKAKLADPEESVTESEDGEPQWVITKPAPAKPKVPGRPAQSDSETELDPESESDLEELEIRPVFPLKEGQTRAEPLVLDKTHRVPGSINTFLREYQRDGIRFFWERYKEDRGGILGDDMGLGKRSRLFHSSRRS